MNEDRGVRVMMRGRREALRAGGGASLLALLAAAGFVKPGEAAAQSAWNKAAFEAKTVPDVLKALGATGARTSGDIVVTLPDIAENGAAVPITVASRLPKTEAIAVVIEKNPNALAAVFEILPGTEPSLSTRVKMGQTSNVYVLVRADGRYHTAVKEVKVTLGGCIG